MLNKNVVSEIENVNFMNYFKRAYKQAESSINYQAFEKDILNHVLNKIEETMAVDDIPLFRTYFGLCPTVVKSYLKKCITNGLIEIFANSMAVYFHQDVRDIYQDDSINTYVIRFMNDYEISLSVFANNFFILYRKELLAVLNSVVEEKTLIYAK